MGGAFKGKRYPIINEKISLKGFPELPTKKIMLNPNPRPLPYREGPVEVKDEPLFPGTDAHFVLAAKSYDGYRVAWGSAKGFEVYTDEERVQGWLQSRPSHKPTFILPKFKTYPAGHSIPKLDTPETQREVMASIRIDRFKKDMVEAAKTRADVQAFIQAHPEMGISV